MKLIEGRPEPELLPMRQTPLTRALWKGIPTFLDLKPDGVTIKDIVAAFKYWDSAVDEALIAVMMQRLITTPMITIVRPGHTSPSPSQAGTNRTVEESGLPREISTAEAARILGVSKDTVLKLKEAGLLEYRNMAPPTSSRPVFAFALKSVLKLRTTYETDEPQPFRQREPRRRATRGERKYKHLNVDY